jgi:hypothetical protein
MVDSTCSSMDNSNNSNGGAIYLDVGFALLGFAGPALQLPTLHLARLFSADTAGQDTQKEGSDGSGGGAAALYMSAQAGAFDGGTMVFAIFSWLAHSYGVTVPTFFRAYLIVRALTLLTAIFFWPNEILPDVSVVSQHSTPTLLQRRRQRRPHRLRTSLLLPASANSAIV